MTDYVIAGINALGDEGAQNWVNHMVEYGQNRFYSDEIFLEAPIYNERLVSKEDFEADWVGSLGGYYFETLGIEGDSLLEVTINNSYEFGSFFYVCEDGRILIPWDGVFFIAERR